MNFACDKESRGVEPLSYELIVTVFRTVCRPRSDTFHQSVMLESNQPDTRVPNTVAHLALDHRHMRSAGLAPARPGRTPAPQAGASAISPRAPTEPPARFELAASSLPKRYTSACASRASGQRRNRTHSTGFGGPDVAITCCPTSAARRLSTPCRCFRPDVRPQSETRVLHPAPLAPKASVALRDSSQILPPVDLNHDSRIGRLGLEPRLDASEAPGLPLADLPMVSNAVTVRANHITLFDFRLQCRPTPVD